MKYATKTKASQYDSDWEYKKDKNEERKLTKDARNLRRNKRTTWGTIDD